ncbi:Uncharacterised protein [Chlamydia trachomatis]|nr:Uncharacterised protein [Chlamydia trachomatis]
MPDFTTLRRANAPRLACGKWREIVMMHIAFMRNRGKIIYLLFHFEHIQGGDAHNLRLSTLENRRAMHARKHACLSSNRTNFYRCAPIHTHALGEHAVAHCVLPMRIYSEHKSLLTLWELLSQLGNNRISRFVQSDVTFMLICNTENRIETIANRFSNSLKFFIFIAWIERILHWLFTCEFHKLFLGFA